MLTFLLHLLSLDLHHDVDSFLYILPLLLDLAIVNKLLRK